jgi:ribonuclease BN (tRNA processing enzyme)
MLPLTLTFIGSGDAFSSGGRLQSGIFIESQTCGLLLDCGATLLTGLQRCNLNTNQIDAVAISHLHGDHFGGIPFLLLDALFINKRAKPLHIFGPPETESRVISACDAFYPGALDGPFPFPVEYHVLNDQTITTHDPFAISTFAVSHGQKSTASALRVEIAGRTIAYSGDTSWNNNLIELARGSDLFICECCNYEEKSPGHLDYLTLKKHVPDLATNRIILTHTGPMIDKNRRSIKLEIASDGLQLQL